MQRFVFLLLAASITLLGAIVPVEATFHQKRETNAHRLARGLHPLPPARRSPTETALRRQTSQQHNQPQTGRLEVCLAVNRTLLGYVYNDAVEGPTGINYVSDSHPADSDLVVEFKGSNLIAQNPAFKPPYYLGGSGTAILSPTNNNTILFTNVESGANASIWTLNSDSRELSAIWTNVDGTKVQVTLLFDAKNNALLFTGNPKGGVSSDRSTLVPIILTLVQ